MTHSAAPIAEVLEGEIGHQLANPQNSASLENMFAQLGASNIVCDHFNLSRPSVVDLITGRRTSLASHMFVDLIKLDELAELSTCGIRIPEASDRSTSCSDDACLEDVMGLYPDAACERVSDINVHVEIDEEDDDLCFFSSHRTEGRQQQNLTNTLQSMTRVEIDEEDDDDIVFSVHSLEVDLDKGVGCLCQPSSTVGEENEELEHSVQKEEAQACGDADECGDVDEWLTQGTMLSCSTQDHVEFESTDPASSTNWGPLHLRSVVTSDSLQLEGGTAHALLANLKGDRAQGVLKHLARKLTQRS